MAMVMFTVVVTVAPSAAVAVTVIVDGPTGVGVGPDFAVVQPTSAPAANTNTRSVRYAGARRNGSILCRTVPDIPSIPSTTIAIRHRVYVVQGPCPPNHGVAVEDPVVPLGMALIVTIDDIAPAVIVPVPTVQLAPVSDCGSAHVTVSEPGNGLVVGFVV